MYILGFSDSVHDRSVVVFKNNLPVIAIEEERLTRIKHGISLYKESRQNPQIFSQMKLEESSSQVNEDNMNRMIKYCLDSLNIGTKDIDLVIGNSLHSYFPLHDKAVYINHHLAHASAAFFSSGFKESAIFVSDGYGDIVDKNTYETVMLAYGKENKIDVKKIISGSVSSYYDMQNSIGVFYRLGSLLSGFGMFDEGKTMGLSAYGKPAYYDEIKKFITYSENMILIDNKMIYDTLKKETPNLDLFEVKADMAASFQKHLEDMVIFYLDSLYKIAPVENVCIAGGVGLNCVMNAQVVKKTKFKNVYIFPGTGDNGISFGAAYFGAHSLLNLKRSNQLDHSYFGKKYTKQDTLNCLSRFTDNVVFFEKKENDIVDIAAQIINDNGILMWFQEGSEFGARALGHRSIFANPAKVETKNYINNNVKFRELFRPLAPIVLEEFVNDYFDFDQKSPFMLFSPHVKQVSKDKISGIIHVDGTARLQTINKKQNKKLYFLIKKVKRMTGVPIVLNTSFNGQDEPIVETPEDAINAFLKSPVQHLFIDNFYITKKNE